MYDKPEFPPLLPDGMDPKTLEELEDLCVTRFPLSETRRQIMAGFRAVVQRIVRAGIEGEIWIDGSFVTEKIDPADVDFFVIVSARFYDSGTEIR